MDRRLQLSKSTPNSRSSGTRQATQRQQAQVEIVDQPDNFQLDYLMLTKRQSLKAKRTDARLVANYRSWLEPQNRTLEAARYGKLQCDCYERSRKNIIEAKSSIAREYVRMAVGQLLDYSFHSESKLGKSNLAILLPERPGAEIEKWLRKLNIFMVWNKKGMFYDNANGQFA